jgi:cysteine-rich repeat protein
MKKVRRLGWGTSVGGVVLVALGGAAACGESFGRACEESYTCPPPDDGAGGEGGEGGRGEQGGEAAQAGVAEPVDEGQGGAPTGEGGASPQAPMVALGEECSRNGELSCSGPAQKLTLLCKDGSWTESGICEADENCDQSTGVCTPILPECADKSGGELYCGAADAVFRCGPDLVASEEVEKCVGRCVSSAASGTCAPETCGDGKEQAPEECDDGNEDETDECTNACTKPVCGDGATWKDHEQCDDGNLKADDTCTAQCVPAVCGDGLIWAGKEGCDDKNKVDTDSCTNACQKAVCGDGVVQAGKEECDDKNTKSGDGCSRTCTVEPVEIVPAGPYTICARGSNGQIRCFGIGSDDWEYATVPLAAGEKVTQISGGSLTDNMCVLVGGKVRCWGSNSFGQLGLGDKVARPFDKPSVNVDLGEGAVAKSVAVGHGYTCAALSDGVTKCWGDNQFNQLGFVKDAANPAIGDAAGEMGAALAPAPQAAGRLSASVAAGHYNACQIRTDKTVSCWGTYARGSYTADGNLNLGAVLTVSQLSLGTTHACAILTNNALKCWGGNSKGQLGLDDTETRHATATMGDALAAVHLGAGKTARYVATRDDFSCAVLNDGSVKCWGDNSSGQLGKGNTTNVGGANGDMATLQPLNLGNGRKAKQLALASQVQCALLEDGTIICWGGVNTPTQQTLGDEPNEMGDNLPVVLLKF